MHETPRLRGVSFQESEIWGATQCGLYTNPDMLTMGGSRSFLGAKWKISSTPTGIASRRWGMSRVGRKTFLTDRKSGVSGKSVSVRVDLGGRSIIKKHITTETIMKQFHK